MTARRVGLAIAGAAILVQAPRLILALLAADRLHVDPAAERALLVVAGIGTALVLTGGNLYLAHTVAQVSSFRRTLVAAWITVLAASGGMAIPLIVAGLTARTVPQVLGARGLEWPWAFLASIAHELTAAGCVLASTASAGKPLAAAAAPAAAPGSSQALLPASISALPAGDQALSHVRQPHDRSPHIPCRAGCGRSFVSHQAEIAHLRHCPRHRSNLASDPAAS
jgi:MFS family permease